jgi:flavodoxin
MKVAVVYFTKTGNSSKIANAISKELQINAEDVKSNPTLNNVDLLFIVGGIYGGASDPCMIEYVKGLNRNMVKKVALVTSCVSQKVKQKMVRDILSGNGIEVIPEEFICQGRFLFIGLGHPNNTDIENALSYVKNVIK